MIVATIAFCRRWSIYDTEIDRLLAKRIEPDDDADKAAGAKAKEGRIGKK